MDKMRPTIDETELKVAQNTTESIYEHNHTRCFLPVILPFSRFYIIWNCIVLVMLMYSVMETPYTLAFVHHTSMRDIAVDITLITDLLFFIDVFISFRTGYVDKYDRLRIICEPRSIAIHYLKTWFAIDVISSMPILVLFAVFCLYQSPNKYFEAGVYLTLTRSFRLLKLFRISKLLKTLQIIQRKTFSNDTRKILRLFKIFGFMLLVAHYCACVWFYVGFWTYKQATPNKSWIDILVDEQSPRTFDEIPNVTKYTYSIYWAIVTLFTTGYGDIHAYNQYEQWASMICILIGSLFFAYFIGVLTTSMNENPKNRYEIEQIEEALIFCSHYNLPSKLREAVIAHIQYYCEYNYVFDEQRVMNSLPNDLQKNVQNYLATSMLCGLDIFKSLSQRIIGQIALKLKSKSVNTGHTLFESGDCCKEIYIQRTGKSKLKYSGSTQHSKELTRGDVCGEDVFLSQKRMHSVLCETWSEFYVLNVSDIMHVLQNNYHVSVANKKWNQIKHRVQSSMRHDLNSRKSRYEAVDLDKEESIELTTRNKQNKFAEYIQLFQKPSSQMRNNLVLNECNKRTEDVMIGLPDYAGSDFISSSITSSNTTGFGGDDTVTKKPGKLNVFNERNLYNRNRKSSARLFGTYGFSVNEKQTPLLNNKD